MAGIVESGGAREADNPEFAGGIGGASFRAAHSADRRTVDDRAGPLRRSLPKLCLHAVPYAAQIDVDDGVELVIIGFKHRGAVAVYACIVERSVEPSIGFDRFRDHRPDLAAVPYVAGDGEDLMARRAQPVYCPFEQRRIVVSEDDRGARFGKSLCRRETDAAASTRNKRNLSNKQHSELSSSKKNCSGASQRFVSASTSCG